MIELGEVRKVATFILSDDSEVAGETLHVLAKNPANDEPLEEKKEVTNDGSFVLAFPADYSGDVYVECHGSAGGSDSNTLSV